MRVVVADLEADNLLADATVVWCGVFLDINTKEKWKFEPHQVKEMLKFMDTCDGMIMHNGLAYDWPLLEKLYGYIYNGKTVDTLVMSRIQNNKRLRPFSMPKEAKGGPHSLASWGYRVGRGKVAHDEWDVYSPEMMHRCDEDVEITLLTYLALLEEADGYDWRGAWNLSFKLFEILHKQEMYGWLVDRPYMDKSIKLLTHWITRIDSIITPLLPLIVDIQETKKAGQVGHLRSVFLKSGKYSAYTLAWYDRNNINEQAVSVVGPFSRVSFRHVDLNSNEETKGFLLSEGWQPEEWNYKKIDGKWAKGDDGQRIRTSAKMSHTDPFNGIQSGVGKMVSRRVQCRHRRSNIEGWIKLIRDDGRIATPVSGLASTGRLKHKGVVNVPGGDTFFGVQMRKCFICKEGYKIVGTDSAGCQLRMLAARMGDDAYTYELLHGDMHTTNQLAAGLATRAQAKTFIYAFLFGAGDAKIGAIVGGGKKEGRALKDRFLAGLPALDRLITELTEEWRGNARTRKVRTEWGVRTEHYDGWVIGLDGRPIRIPSEHAVLVYVLQSDEAIMMSAAYCLLYKRAIAKGWKFGEDWAYLIFYHDEYQCEVKEELCEEFAILAEECIVDAGEFYNISCPHKGTSKTGVNWYETH